MLKSPIYSGVDWDLIEAYSMGQVYLTFFLHVKQNGSFENYNLTRKNKKNYALIIIGKNFNNHDLYYLQIVLSKDQFLAKDNLEFDEAIDLLNNIHHIEVTSKGGIEIEDLKDLEFDFEWLTENNDPEIDEYKQKYL